MTQPCAADDFATIRACIEELRREREGGYASEGKLRSERPHQGRTDRGALSEARPFWLQVKLRAAFGSCRSPTRAKSATASG